MSAELASVEPLQSRKMTPLERYGLVAIGGAIGSMLRYGAAIHFGATASTTFVVNITGAFLIGLLAASAIGMDPRLRLLLGSGLLGGYTTFSTWQLEAVLAAREGDGRAALAILAGSVVAGFVAAFLGYTAGLRLR